MSRIANLPVNIPQKVEVTITPDNVLVKGPLGQLSQSLTGDVSVIKENNAFCHYNKYYDVFEGSALIN